MINLDKAPDPLLAALHNCKSFDVDRFQEWAKTRSTTVLASIVRRPPNRIYRHVRGFVFVAGYEDTGRLILELIDDRAARPFTDSVESVTDVTDEVAAKYQVLMK